MNNQEWRYFIAHGLSKQSRFFFIRIARVLEVEIKDHLNVSIYRRVG
jgi:hypothetical protein